MGRSWRNSVLQYGFRIAAVSVLTPVILALSLPPFTYGWLSWVALVPWSMGLRRLTSAADIAVATASGGLLFHCRAFFVMGASEPEVLWTRLLVPILCQWMVAGGLLVWLQRRSSWPFCVCVPIAWVTGEIGLKYVAEDWLRIAVNPVMLGLTQVNSSLIHVAASAGVLGMSWVIATANGVVCDLWPSRGRRDERHQRFVGFGLVGVCGLAVIVQTVMAGHVSFGTGPRIAIIPMCFDHQDPLVNQLLQTRLETPAVAVWPELSGSMIGPGVYVEGGRAIEAASQAWGLPLVVGTYRLKETPRVEVVNAVAVATPSLGLIGWYEKQFLVPWHEPSLSNTREYQSLANGKFPVVAGIGPGPHLSLPRWNVRLGFGICYDAAFAEWGRRAMTANPPPDVLVVCGLEPSEKWPAVSQWMLSCARIRAVECRRPVVRCVAGGASVVINSNGDIVDCDPGRPYVSIPVPLDRRISIYRLVGDLPMLVLIAFSLLLRLIPWNVAQPPPTKQ